MNQNFQRQPQMMRSGFQQPHMMQAQMNPQQYQQMMAQQAAQQTRVAKSGAQSPSIPQLIAKWDFFLQMDRNQQRNIMGEVIYPFVLKYNKEYAPKITGMLIDLDPEELKQCLLNENHMIQKIHEAGAMLKQSDSKAAQKKQSTPGRRPNPESSPQPSDQQASQGVTMSSGHKVKAQAVV